MAAVVFQCAQCGEYLGEVPPLITVSGETFPGCPICQTDEFLERIEVLEVQE